MSFSAETLHLDSHLVNPISCKRIPLSSVMETWMPLERKGGGGGGEGVTNHAKHRNITCAIKCDGAF